MEKLLAGKSALITGGNRGIGRAITEKFVAEGARVALHYHNHPAEAESLKAEHDTVISLFRADLSDAEETSRLFETVISSLGSIDVIVNNAGIAVHSDLSGTDKEWIGNWDKTLQVNLNAAGILCRNAILHFMDKRKKGTIINIASRAAFRGDTADYLAYAASKGGLVALTRSIARAFGKKGIVAFTIAPGFVITDMSRQFFEEYGEENCIRNIALDKVTRPEDVAPLVAFLASGQVNHATGGTFDINAGSYVH